MTSDAIVVPLKRFDQAKSRLRHTAGDHASAIARTLAQGVIAASQPRPVIVVGEDRSVSEFALTCGAEAFESNAQDLNQAVDNAYRALGSRYERLIVVHGDLRYPEGLGDFEPAEGITIFTDHVGTGTNVLVLPTGMKFSFGYGPNSARHHVVQAQILGVPLHVERDSAWGFDVDDANDMN